MPEPDLIQIFIVRLNRLKARYMITGSIAATIYGEPRLTHDIDLVLELESSHIDKLHSIFPNDDFSVPPKEVLLIESQREVRGHCNIIDFKSGLKADLYFLGKDPLHRWAIEQRRMFQIEKEEVWIAPPEYVIVRKLLYFHEGGSEKHLRDIKLMLEHSSNLISIPQLLEKIAELGILEEWERAKSFKV